MLPKPEDVPAPPVTPQKMETPPCGHLVFYDTHVPFPSVTADSAYDGEPVYRAVAERQPDPPAAVVIPPRVTAVASPTADTTPTQRDRHIRMIRDKGRMGGRRRSATASAPSGKPPCSGT